MTRPARILDPPLPFVDPGPRARTTHPRTSKDAGDAMRISARLGALQGEALWAVRNYPGNTAPEIAELCGLDDERILGRRLSELERRGLIYAQGTRPNRITGRPCQLWWPHEENS